MFQPKIKGHAELIYHACKIMQVLHCMHFTTRPARPHYLAPEAKRCRAAIIRSAEVPSRQRTKKAHLANSVQQMLLEHMLLRVEVTLNY